MGCSCPAHISGLPTIWTQLREAATGRAESAGFAIQGNRASRFRTNLSPTALVISKPPERNVGTVRRGKSNRAANR